MRSKRWSPTYVIVQSTVPEVFPSIVRYKVNLTMDTWNDVLTKNGIIMDTNEYCLKTCGSRIIVGVDTKVASFVQAYTQKQNAYKVRLCRLTVRDREKLGIYRAGATQHTGFANQGARTRPNVTSGEAQSDVHLGPFQDAINRNNRDLGSFGIEQNQEHHESEQQHQSHYAEDSFELPQDYFNEAPGRSAEDLNDSDTESQLTQDSQMDLDLEDTIKKAALDRLKLTPNSVCQKVREEIENLKQRPNYMKISGYAPAVFNIVGYLFQVRE